MGHQTLDRVFWLTIMGCVCASYVCAQVRNLASCVKVAVDFILLSTLCGSSHEQAASGGMVSDRLP